MSVFDDKVFGNGSHYVYYQRLAEDTHFGSAPLIYLKASLTSGEYTNILKSIDLDIVQVLRDQASAERQKELNVLRRIAPSGNYENMSMIELINQINKLIGLGDQYETYLKYLRDVYPTANRELAKNMSPVVSSYMSSKIATLINTYCENYLLDALAEIAAANGNSSKVNAAADKFASKVIFDFIADTNNITTQLLEHAANVNHTLGDGQEYLIWKDLMDTINQDYDLKNKFITDVMRRFGLQEKIKKAYNSMKNQTYKTHKTAMRKAIEVTAAPQGGYIYEVINDIMQGLAIKSRVNSAVISSSRMSDKGTTDLFTASIDFDFSDIVEQKARELETGTKDKADAVSKVTEFTEFLKNNVGDGFIIYGNAKSYRLDRLSDKQGYFDGGKRNILQLPSFMAKYEVPISEEMVDIVLNTIPGAIMEGNSTVQEFITQALAGQVARLLFDDWTTIGDTSSSFDAIHVFNLSGVTVPLSYLLYNMAEAAEAAAGDLISHPSSFFQVEFDLPKKIRFEQPGDTTAWIHENKPKENSKNRGNGYLQMAWDEQRREALRSTFGVNFLSNFNNLLNQLMSSLGI